MDYIIRQFAPKSYSVSGAVASNCSGESILFTCGGRLGRSVFSTHGDCSGASVFSTIGG